MLGMKAFGGFAAFALLLLAATRGGEASVAGKGVTANDFGVLCEVTKQCYYAAGHAAQLAQVVTRQMEKVRDLVGEQGAQPQLLSQASGSGRSGKRKDNSLGPAAVASGSHTMTGAAVGPRGLTALPATQAVSKWNGQVAAFDGHGTHEARAGTSGERKRTRSKRRGHLPVTKENVGNSAPRTGQSCGGPRRKGEGVRSVQVHFCAQHNNACSDVHKQSNTGT
ncbi:hypothetical protein TRVL_04023 [Trypanosoma vivax]|nr:hypothetical protein TRVL_04023 [Trypanosoma vivax]